MVRSGRCEIFYCFFFQAEDGIRDLIVTGVQTCALPIFSLSLRPMNILRLTAIYLAAGVPFFFTGLLFSVVFARASRWVTQLYGTDLTGGAPACLAVGALLNWLGGANTGVWGALVLAVGAAGWA